MSPYGSINTVYHAEVTVPNDIVERFAHTPEYEHVANAAARIVEASGQNSYDKVIEWGEAPVRRQCEDFIAYWHNHILQWQRQIRSEA